MLIILAIWLLINVLFVIAVTPPCKPRRSNRRMSSYLPPAAIDENSHHFAEEEANSIQHTIFAVALGAFSIAPPLLDVSNWLRRRLSLQLLSKSMKERPERSEGE